ncbi:MAG: branched-chain amino acid ABC transporter permease, partial [Rhizobiales bacterium]|nr:branched-chain amino acid ABC transporter permease [Hyphomicrobiales bacterium]
MKLLRNPVFLFLLYGTCILAIGLYQSPSLALSILALGLISAIMSLGVNIQWGYAGLLNIGVMGFAAIGGASAVWVAADPVPEAWAAGGIELAYVGLIIISTIGSIIVLNRFFTEKSLLRTIAKFAIIFISYLIVRPLFTAAVESIEAVNPTISGFLGGFGAPIVFSWVIGGLIAAMIAWLIGKVALGLRADYLGIATLGIAEILISVLKNEDWLTRGVKNVVGLKR